MSGTVLRIVAEIGPRAALMLVFVVVTFVVYVGIALVAVLCARDVQQGELRYRLFRNLLGLFRPRGRR